MLGSALRHRRPLRACVGVAMAALLGCLACADGEDVPASLHEAVLRGDVEALGSLLAAGAGTEVTDPEGLTPLQVAARSGQQAALALLLRTGAELQPVNPVQSMDLARPTPLYYASWGGHAELVEWLIEQGADLSRGAAGGWTPFHVAAEKGHDAVAERLLAHGASLESRTGGGWTPLYLAARAGHAELALLLLERGADADPPLPRGWTVLHAAAQGDD